ncbi:MAG: hypothetical protein ACE5GJ_00125 [Gemmatimonadota bacterium]
MRNDPQSPRGPEPLRLGFGTANHPILVEVEPDAARPVAEALFPDDRLPSPPAPAAAWPHVLRLSAEGEGYRLLAAWRRGSWTTASLRDILIQLELTLAELLVRNRGHVGLHAGGVVLPGVGALLFAGPGGCGKSSLTAAFARRGHAVLGDDVVFLEDGVVHSFHRLLKVEEPARTLLDLPAPTGPLAHIWPDAVFYHPGALGSRWADPAPVAAVILPQRFETEGDATHPPVLEAVRPAEILPALLRSVVLVDRIGTDAFTQVSTAVAGARCFLLRYSETASALDVILSALSAPGATATAG